MTTREKAHKLLDELPEDELEPIVEILASRGKTDRTAQRDARSRARDFLISVANGIISVANGSSGLDLVRLRSVRDRAWR